LVKEDVLFDEINSIECRKYKRNLVVFYKRERTGRLFYFYEGKAKKYVFDFGVDSGGEVSTNKLTDIDKPLIAAFAREVKDSEAGAGGVRLQKGKFAQPGER
jgi:hypothetical protein